MLNLTMDAAHRTTTAQSASIACWNLEAAEVGARLERVVKGDVCVLREELVVVTRHDKTTTHGMRGYRLCVGQKGYTGPKTEISKDE